MNAPSPTVDEAGRLQIRQIDPAVWADFRLIAAEHGRSNEAEGREALTAWVEAHARPFSRRAGPAPAGIVARLLAAQEQYQAAFQEALQPSRLAEAIGLARGAPAEAWFAGALEPTFPEIRALAEVLGVEYEWLAHGAGHPYPVRPIRHIDDPVAMADALMTFSLDGEPFDGAPTVVPVSRLRVVRSKSKSGELLYVQEGAATGLARPVRVVTTHSHVSDVIGNGGMAMLTTLWGALEILYKRHVHNNLWSFAPRASRHTGFMLTGYIVPEKVFERLSSGDGHPLAVLKSQPTSTWVEDAWDYSMWNRCDEYWPGAKSLFRTVHSEKEKNRYLNQVMADWSSRRSRGGLDVIQAQLPFHPVE